MRRLGAGLAFVLPLAVYLGTLARHVTFIDSGELAAAAATLGIAHPPGYPLFTILGFLFSRLPFETVFFRIGLVSALAAATSALLIWQIGRSILDQRHDAAGGNRAAFALAPLAGAWVFAFGRTLWSQAVTVEVYTLQAFLMAGFLYACAVGLGPGETRFRSWPWAALAVGFSLTNHLTGMLLIPTLMVFLAFTLAGGSRRSGRPPWALTAVALLAPLSLYLYLPIRSRQDPVVNWDYPDTWHRFLVHVTARQYQGHLGRFGLRVEELRRFAQDQIPAESGLMLILLAGLGMIVLAKWSWRFLLVSVLAALAALFFNVIYPIRDVALYYIPVLLVMAIWAAVGAGGIVVAAARWRPTAGVFAAVVLALASVSPAVLNWKASDQRQFDLVHRYVQDTLGNLETGAVVFSDDWESFSSPALYEQRVGGLRPDVLVLDYGRTAGSGFLRGLERFAPDLAEAVRVQADSVRAIAVRAEKRQPYDVEASKAVYRRFLESLVRESVHHRPTYIAGYFDRHPLFGGYVLRPEGVAFRLAESDTFETFSLRDLQGPGIGISGARNEAERAIVYQYNRMFRGRVRYLERHGRREEAEAMQQALQGLF